MPSSVRSVLALARARRDRGVDCHVKGNAHDDATRTSMSGSQVLPIGAPRIGRTAVELPDGLAVRHDPRQIGDVPLDQPAPLADVDLELADAPFAERPLLREGQRLGTAVVRAVEDLGVQELPPAAPGAADLPGHG